MKNNIIKLSELDFKYKRKQEIFKDFSMDVPLNSIYCLAGPNGAGKTTLLKLISNFLTQHSGQISIESDTKYSLKNDIYFYQDTPLFYNNMNARTNLEILCDYKMRNYNGIDEVLNRAGLTEPKKKLKEYSLGMKKRLSLALVLLFDAKIILMDEPFNSLDPSAIKFIREFIIEEHAKGKSFIISSHLLREMGSFCTHFGIINNGKLLVEGENKGDIDLIEEKYFDSIEKGN